ncbi:putative molybdenum carrier protein [Stratiformator vulcanicus]|uniref:Molybdenum carrier n=1 Tax=Stratiformator vulcanicus TaxID=2527980 RepID=A0A517QXZ0_9PLAN|nr:putative molybdenum carrier protein [Stratiformator vulcanicus]QDT36501.1 Putative molybdenum carrier [Stratiformator vulcanicus]
MQISSLTIISGGQTGVDRAALDVALELRLACRGWCPRGRRAEDGVLGERYPLTETESPDYAVRTKLNVRDSDGTLILFRGVVSGGTFLTAKFAMERHKPVRLVDLSAPPPAGQVAGWVKANRIAALNIAGPRESTHPGIAAEAATYLRLLFGMLGDE